MATPLLFVLTVAEPEKLPLAPPPGAANVTVAPATGLLPPSLTVAWSAVPKTVLIVALCGVPAVAVILAGPVTPLTAARISTILRLYRSPVGAVSLIVTLVALKGVGVDCRCTQYVSPTVAIY
jgi:hypothetical protein